MPINADKTQNWKADTRASVDQFNQWFMTYAPKAYRDTRSKTVHYVEDALVATVDLRNITIAELKKTPAILQTLRMSTCRRLRVTDL